MGMREKRKKKEKKKKETNDYFINNKQGVYTFTC